jgi:hypothetical protein
MYNPAVRKIQLTSLEGKRFKTLGDIGESIAEDILFKNDFKDISNLNKIKKNFHFADFVAVKNDSKYLISVKTRNKYENSGKLNSRYKLGKKVYEHIKSLMLESQWEGYIPAWLTISMEPNCFDSYFGTIEQLKGSKGISMSNKAKLNYVQLALKNPHNHHFSNFGNIYSAK